MKTHTTDFKNEIKQFGKEIDSKITYTSGGQTIELGKEDLNSITPHYEGSILKSVMRQLDVDSNVLIDEGTVINYQFGLKVDNSYEYLNYGNYVVYKVEKQEDTNSYKLTCYDKMLYAMKDYESLGVTYPITIKNYLTALCSKIGLTLKSGDFANQDRTIASELYLDSDGGSLDYTYRDVLDEIAQATGSTICINEDDDELEVRYVSNTGTMSTVEGTSILIPNSDDEKFDLQLQGNTTQADTPTPSSPQPINVVSGRQEVVVCGKNLLNLKDGTYTATDITAVVENGEITLNGTADANRFIPIPLDNNLGITQNETITLSMNNAVANSNVKFRINSGGQLDTTLNAINKTQTINIGAYTDLLSSSITIRVQSGTTLTNFKLKPMIEKGETPSTYEAYKGQSYEINLGKNLFDKSTITSIINGTIENDVITSNAISSDYGGVSANISGLTLEAGTYYISTKVKRVSGTSGGTLTRITLVGIDSSQITMVDNPTITNEYQIYSCRISPTAPVTITNIGIQLRPTNVSAVMSYTNIMVSKDSNTNYAPYKTPIELCKIGTYQDFIKKGTGKNFINYSATGTGQDIDYNFNDSELSLNGTTSSSGQIAITNTQPITLQAGTYTFSSTTSGTFTANGKSTAIYLKKLSDNTNIVNLNQSNSYVATSTFTLNEKTKVYVQVYTNGAGFVFNNFKIQWQLELGNQATSYEPYGFDGKWYIEKNIGKHICTGSSSENWYITGTYHLQLTFGGQYRLHFKQTGLGLSNYFPVKTSGTDIFLYPILQSGTDYIRIQNGVNEWSTTTAWKTWLQSHNLIFYYPLDTPTYTEITDTELLSQLNAPRLLEGLNNITISSGDLSSPVKITYLSSLDTIDEEYLKNVNVNFGDKFGKVNSIVLSRSAESDNVYIQDEESIEKNGLCEIKIKDNQIMNDNNRADFLPELLEKLDGLEYYINDFASPGITYYNLCDRYKVKIGDNYYKCIMFNDEVNVTQGLEENVYTEMPEETETEYQYASKDDRTINKAYIIVKKNEAEIEELASKVVDVSNTITGINTITLENAYEGILHRLEITGNLSCLFPSESLEPSDNLIPIETILDVDEEKYVLDIDYLEYVSNEDCDKYVYEDGKQWIERRNGTIEEKEDLTINITKESVLTLEHFDNMRLTCLYLLENEYTSTFANQVEVSSELKLLADTFEAKVSQVADDDGNVTSASIILAVNNDTSSATIEADKININGIVTANENFKILTDGSMEANNGTFNGSINGGAINVSGNYTEADPYIEVENPNSTTSAPIGTRIWSNGISCYDYSSGGNPVIRTENNDGYAQLTGAYAEAYGFINVSKESEKTNIKELRDGLKTIKETSIYEYNYNGEKDDDKKHIGLVIGDSKKSYNTPEEVISKDRKGIDLYAMTSLSWKAIKELAEQNEKLQQEIDKLKKEMNK